MVLVEQPCDVFVVAQQLPASPTTLAGVPLRAECVLLPVEMYTDLAVTP
jgi:hypothetical protein